MWKISIVFEGEKYPVCDSEGNELEVCGSESSEYESVCAQLPVTNSFPARYVSYSVGRFSFREKKNRKNVFLELNEKKTERK